MISVWESEVFAFWDQNPEVVLRAGGPTASLYQQFDSKPKAWETFSSFEMAIANWLRGPLLSRTKLYPGTRRLLDVGGGHGLYAVMFCQKYPALTATIFDRPEPLKVARKNIDSNGLKERIRLQSGDFLTDDLGEGYDIALLFNIIHNFREEQNIEVLRKINKALNPEGSVVIFDNISRPGISKTAIDFFSLTYLVTVGGQTYTLNDLKRWFEETGFKRAKTTLRLPGLVQARKQT